MGIAHIATLGLATLGATATATTDPVVRAPAGGSQRLVRNDLSAAMVDYWSSFARFGVPSARNQPAWPAHNKDAACMIFSGKPQVAADLMPGQYQLHDQVICRRRAAGNIPWNWNFGVTSPALPPAQETCR